MLNPNRNHPHHVSRNNSDQLLSHMLPTPPDLVRGLQRLLPPWQKITRQLFPDQEDRPNLLHLPLLGNPTEAYRHAIRRDHRRLLVNGSAYRGRRRSAYRKPILAHYSHQSRFLQFPRMACLPLERERLSGDPRPSLRIHPYLESCRRDPSDPPLLQTWYPRQR